MKGKGGGRKDGGCAVKRKRGGGDEGLDLQWLGWKASLKKTRCCLSVCQTIREPPPLASKKKKLVKNVKLHLESSSVESEEEEEGLLVTLFPLLQPGNQVLQLKELVNNRQSNPDDYRAVCLCAFLHLYSLIIQIKQCIEDEPSSFQRR